MPTGIRPRVNEAREFLEIAKDFKDPKEIIREALSNSWDAQATEAEILFDLAPIQGSRRKKIKVTIADNGEGMSTEQRPSVGSSEIEGFFNLGDSAKGAGSIGSKGHGTKIFYKSHGITLTTWKNGQKIIARTETDPWESLRQGFVPTFGYDETPDDQGRGTRIIVDGFEAKQNQFSSLEELITYIRWYTVASSFAHHFGEGRMMDVKLRPAGNSTTVTVPFGFHFPGEEPSVENGTDSFCHIFGPEVLSCGVTEDGADVKVQIVGALLGEEHRNIVPSTYDHMGLWLAKDYIRIERNNSILEDAFGGQYYYRNFLIFANCQSFDLTANRNNIRGSQQEYDLAIAAITEWCKKVEGSSECKAYFAAKKSEDDRIKKEKAERDQKEKEKRTLDRRNQRINAFKGRADLKAPGVAGAPLKEPRSEAETALLLQAMISSGHEGIDFTIGDYNTTRGCDILAERKDKGFTGLWWVELVSRLDQLNEWSHHPEGYHAVVCYELGQTSENFGLSNGASAKLVKKDAPGRYTLLTGKDTLEVYVLREIIAA